MNMMFFLLVTQAYSDKVKKKKTKIRVLPTGVEPTCMYVHQKNSLGVFHIYLCWTRTALSLNQKRSDGHQIIMP